MLWSEEAGTTVRHGAGLTVLLLLSVQAAPGPLRHLLEEVLCQQVISTHRRCRDLIYLILFAAFWGGMLYVAYLAFHRGTAVPCL